MSKWEELKTQTDLAPVAEEHLWKLLLGGPMREAWKNVEELLNCMKPILLEAGIPPHQVCMPVGREAHEIKIEQYANSFDWLHRLASSPQYEAIKKAKALRTEALWLAYKAYGFKGLQEQIILEKAQENLRRAWRSNRPSFFGRVYKDKNQENSDGECVQSEGAGTNESDC